MNKTDVSNAVTALSNEVLAALADLKTAIQNSSPDLTDLVTQVNDTKAALLAAVADDKAAVGSGSPAGPVITSFSPSTVNHGGPAFNLTVNGSGFVSGDQIGWNFNALPTNFVSPTQLTATITADLFVNAQTATLSVFSNGVPASTTSFVVS